MVRFHSNASMIRMQISSGICPYFHKMGQKSSPPVLKQLRTSISPFKEVIPWFGLPMSIHSTNGPLFDSQKIRQGLTAALGIDYKWRLLAPPVFREGRQNEPYFKKTSAKLCQETHEPGPACFFWYSTGSVQPSGLRLNPLEMTYGRPSYYWHSTG